MKTITLTLGCEALVDDEDFERVNQYKWLAHLNHNVLYGGRRAKKIEREHGSPQHIFLHRFILGTKPGISVDHIDGNGLNNQKSNLRECTMSQNIANSRRRRDNTSGYKGVHWHKGYKYPSGAWRIRPKWSARISLKGKRISLGYFTTKEEAAKAYALAAKKYHGEFSAIE